VLPTVYDSRRSTAEISGAGIRLWRERVDHSVHSSPCALHHAVRDVFSGNRRVFRHVPRRADRPSLNTANANPNARNTENNAFIVLKYRCTDAICVYLLADSRIVSCLKRIVRENTNSHFQLGDPA
jgi:hypothetical protein